MLYAQLLAEYLPDGRGELYTPVCSDDGWNTKLGDLAATRASAHAVAVVEVSGSTSIHLVVLSTMVSTWV